MSDAGASRVHAEREHPEFRHNAAGAFETDETASTTPTHYDADYFAWQRPLGEFGGWANLTNFSGYIDSQMKVIEFGCGGGYLLANIECAEKIGIEVNPVARREAQRNGITTVASSLPIEDDWADRLISNHALEHCLEPYQELCLLKRKLKPEGMAIFLVPCETLRFRYREADINQHLYSWSPMSLANLFQRAGFNVVESRPYLSLWSTGRIYTALRHWKKRALFDFVCRCRGFATALNPFRPVSGQIRIIAIRPSHREHSSVQIPSAT